jgi:predicted AlkP superfamily pyrophosphatase or phosphodiesterase
VLVSIDGFASYYLDDPKADIPNLRRLAREGAFARRMEVSFPSVTWTCHTTLVTGCHPARHGVLANRYFDRARRAEVALIGDAVFAKPEVVRVPTIYDAAHAAGLETAAVIWPATSGASTLDWLIPDSSQEALHRKYTTPGLVQELEQAGLPASALGLWGWDHAYSAPRDDLYARIAVHLLASKQPGLLLLHLITPDAVEHDHGPRTPEAYWAVRNADQRIGELVKALEAPALRGRAALIVAADHGFLPFDREIRPNALLVKEGLAEFVEENKVKRFARGQAWAVSSGGSAAVYALEEDPAARAALASKLGALFEAVEGVERVLRPAEFPALGLPDPREDPRQGDLVLVAREGYSFSADPSGEALVKLERPKGNHGYLPDHPAMGALFIAWGAGVRRGAVLDTVRAVDVAPTAAALLGIPFEGTDGRVSDGVLAGR